jgi:hypothetical protein
MTGRLVKPAMGLDPYRLAGSGPRPRSTCQADKGCLHMHISREVGLRDESD